MCTNQVKVNLGFSEELFPAGTHMCLIYNSDEERDEVISKFVDAGLKSGERVAYFCDNSDTDALRDWLSHKGIDITSAEKANQLILATTQSVYYPTGEFSPESMLNNLIAFHQSACNDHLPASRVTGEMCWATKGIPGSDRLIEYEAQGRVFLSKYPVTVVCQYHADKFDGATLLECLKVHPYMIVYGQIVRNPYYLNNYIPRVSFN